IVGAGGRGEAWTAGQSGQIDVAFGIELNVGEADRVRAAVEARSNELRAAGVQRRQERLRLARWAGFYGVGGGRGIGRVGCASQDRFACCADGEGNYIVVGLSTEVSAVEERRSIRGNLAIVAVVLAAEKGLIEAICGGGEVTRVGVGSQVNVALRVQ